MNRHLNVVLILLVVIYAGCTRKIPNEIHPLDLFNFVQHKIPLFAGTINQGVIEIKLSVSESKKSPVLKSVTLKIDSLSCVEMIESVSVYHNSGEKQPEILFGETGSISTAIIINGSMALNPGNQSLSVSFSLKEDAGLHQSFSIKHIELEFNKERKLILEPRERFVYRTAGIVRAGGQDNCDTYRIPGLVTTNRGTLIAVYDNRYNSSKDLQEDIDVGMSRSTDGGQTWEPMRVIMDMGEWGGHPENRNGIGDPCVIFDHATGTLWVAALWMCGATEKDMLWWASRPGMQPDETGQFILVKSNDDGLTWSAPINITAQVKNPEWQLLLQGPGRGITLKDGTLVFPAQFKADTGKTAIDGGGYTCHSTIVYSQNGGKTWKIGTGAKSNTTEAQVVQLADGSLMLNMRDDRNRTVKDETNGRAVAVTSDLGTTWSVHPSSNSALPEPNCMASLIAADIEIDGKMQQVLFFSNPNNRDTRTNLTIKVSLDGGHTWPEDYWLELNETKGFGYSCMTMVDEFTIGILYEGTKDLYFQTVGVKEILKDKNLIN